MQRNAINKSGCTTNKLQTPWGVLYIGRHSPRSQSLHAHMVQVVVAHLLLQQQVAPHLQSPLDSRWKAQVNLPGSLGMPKWQN